jgi:hypothetical protein
MRTSLGSVRTEKNWPPEASEIVESTCSDGPNYGVVKEVRWGLVWRDFILEDGRVIPEHRISGCPESPTWRKADEVSQDEREAWEERLVSLAESGVDPRNREQTFWAELNQYLAYIYLKLQRAKQKR